MDTQLDPNIIIRLLGGTSETARICDIKPPSVSEWRKNGIPKAQLNFLRAAYPEVFRGKPAKRKPIRKATRVPSAE